MSSKYETEFVEYIKSDNCPADHRGNYFRNKLSPQFISANKASFNPDVWAWICKYQYLDEQFILECRDYVDVHNICKYQYLSENLIWELRDMIQCEEQWSTVAKHQIMGQELIFHLKDMLDIEAWEHIATNHTLGQELIFELRTYFDKSEEIWDQVISNQNLSETLIFKLKDHITKEQLSLLDESISEEFILQLTEYYNGTDATCCNQIHLWKNSCDTAIVNKMADQILNRLMSKQLSKKFKTQLLDAIDTTDDHDKIRMAHAANFWRVLGNK